MKKLFKRLWLWLITPIEYESTDDNIDYSKWERIKKDTSSWCPFCGASMSSDELRCHLLNDHKK